MRQFFSWRLWAACVALLLGFVVLKTFLPGSSAKAAVGAPIQRKIEFASWIYLVDSSEDFAVVNGTVQGSADLVIDGQRTMHVYAGTRGSNTCTDYKVPGACAVLADLLGDAVVWFALVPMQTGFKVTAPPIVDVLDGGYALLQNGWVVKMPEEVERRCQQETSSLSEFRRLFGPGSTSIIDVSEQKLTIVECAAQVSANG